MTTPKTLRLPALPLLLLLHGLLPAGAQVVISEIQYHPVEEPAFNTNGTPVHDLTDDVHEFIEIRNTGAAAVELNGWQLTSGISFTFPAGTTIAAGGYRVVAKNPAAIASVYGLPGGTVLGAYTGQLSNSGETVNLRNAADALVDSVTYSSGFPWAISADAMGAGKDFWGLSAAQWAALQYKGRSLQRVGVTAASGDPANWLAATPTPGAAAVVSRAVPKPVVIAQNVYQDSNESAVIRSGQQVGVDITFSSTASLSNVQLEYFNDDVATFNETRSTVTMTHLGNGQYTVLVPGQADRSVVRWRIKANRGDGLEVVLPRADDPQITPVTTTVNGTGNAVSGSGWRTFTREGWNAWFVQPVRASTRPIYDFFVWDDGTADDPVDILNYNIVGNPRRVSTPDPPGNPRAEGYINPGEREWDGVVPAIFVHKGVVHDTMTRYHGSRYRRNAGLNSWKIDLPNFRLDEGRQRLLVTEKGADNVLGYNLFHEAGLVATYAQFVDFYKNGNGVIQRCEIGDNDEENISRWQAEKIAANPTNPPVFDGLGIAYKAKGLDGSEGPYGSGNGQPFPARSPWTSLDRFTWTYSSQLNDWKGALPLKTMVDAMWAARGDASQVVDPNTYAGQNHNNQTAVNINVSALRTWMQANWNVDATLSALAIRNWCSPWDDKFHNHLVYQQHDGKWTIMPWDFDSEMTGTSPDTAAPTNSIFAGRKNDMAGTYSNNSRGPNWFKDPFLRAFEAEYKQRLFILNNTLLSPTNIAALATRLGITYDSNWVNSRFTSINTQLGLGPWYSPNKPTNQTPATGGNAVPPSTFQTSAYSHTKPAPRPHGSTTWEIRTAAGTYQAPVYKLTSTTALTSLPIPFDVLTLGQTYFWRVTYTDVDGHPSAASDETSFTYGLAVTPLSLIAIDETTQWRYFQTGAPPLDAENDDWKSAAYDDGAWPSGAALFYNESALLPEPKRTLLTLGRMTYYFRNHFTFPGDSGGAILKLKHIVDDGLVVYLNGAEVYRYQVTVNPVLDTSPASAGVGDAVYVGPVVIPSTALVPGANVLAVEVHQISAGSNDVAFGLSLEAVIANMRITEVMADNRSAVSNGGDTPDWIELYNGSSVTVDLGGMSLSDDVAVPNKYVFPAGTMIPAQGYLVVWCDNNTTAPGLHTGFGLSSGGQTIGLFDSAGTVRDTVTFGPQAPDFSIGRIPTDGDTWKLNIPTPGNANQEQTPLGLTSALRINEWMARPATGEDWFEIHNTSADPVALGGLWLSDTPATPKITQIPPLSFIAGKGFTRFIADNSIAGGEHVNFTLNKDGESVLLSDSAGTTVLNRVDFGAQTSGVSQGRLPDASTSTAFFSTTASPGASNWLPISGVVINEALSASPTPLEDMIELRNNSASSVALGGWFLSDSASDLKKYQIPAGTNLATGDYLVFYETQFNAGANGFALDSTGGDSIYLSAADAGGNLTGYRVQVGFGAAASGVSFGRIVNANGEHFAALTARSFPGANAAPVVGPVIINEIMYHPPDLPGGVDNVNDEFIELHNTGFQPVALHDPANSSNRWRLRDAVDFTFPAWTTFAGGGFILVVNFDPADTTRLAAFRATYGLSPSVPVYGPWSGKLANDQESVELVKPLPPVDGAIPWVLADQVRYHDNTPWPSAADGGGPSLQRIDRSSYGNDPAVWTSGTTTGGANNITQPPMGDGDTDDDGLPDWWETLYGFDPDYPGEQYDDSDGDGANNGAEFAAGTDPRDPADVFRAEITLDGAAGIILRFTAKPGLSYTIQYAATPGGPWENLADVPAGAPGAVDTPDTPGTTPTFYRVVTPQQP